MCVEVYNLDTKEVADSVKQFTEMIGLDDFTDLPIAEPYNMIFEGGCLCQVNIEKACKEAGFSVKLNQDFDTYHISKQS